MANKIQVRRGTAAEWASANPTLAAGEPGFDTTNKVFKVGDGATAWASLPEVVDLTDVTGDVADHESRIDALESAGGGDAGEPWITLAELRPKVKNGAEQTVGVSAYLDHCVLTGFPAAQLTGYQVGSIPEVYWVWGVNDTKPKMILGVNNSTGAVETSFSLKREIKMCSHINIGGGQPRRQFYGMAYAGTNLTTSVPVHDFTDPSLVISHFGFYYNDHGSSPSTYPNWQFVVANGSATQMINTGLPFSIDTDFAYTITATPTGIEWRIKKLSTGTEVSGTVTTGLPASTHNFVPWIGQNLGWGDLIARMAYLSVSSRAMTV